MKDQTHKYNVSVHSVQHSIIRVQNKSFVETRLLNGKGRIERKSNVDYSTQKLVVFIRLPQAARHFKVLIY